MQGLKIITTLLICLTLSSCRTDEPTKELPTTIVGISIDSLVRRVAIPSLAMDKIYNANIILPENYFLDSTLQSYPVVYLLHGYSGNYAHWYEKAPIIASLASKYDMIIVTPEGGYASWYLDSPIDSSSQFFTYISREVPGYIDEHFRTYTDGRYRGITGFSMGGHGALSIALKLPNWFGVVGSMSGAVDVRSIREDYEIDKLLGEYEADSLLWAKHSVVVMSSEPTPKTPRILIDCGVDDIVIEMNRLLHQTMLDSKIPHTYIERPGEHTWLYWEDAIEFQLKYFDKVFKEG